MSWQADESGLASLGDLEILASWICWGPEQSPPSLMDDGFQLVPLLLPEKLNSSIMKISCIFLLVLKDEHVHLVYI